MEVIDIDLDNLNLVPVKNSRPQKIDLIDIDLNELSVNPKVPVGKKLYQLLDVEGKSMECEATYIGYDENDFELIEKLDYYNGDCHGWYGKSIDSTTNGLRSRKRRKAGADLPDYAKEYLEQLRMKKPTGISVLPNEFVRVKMGDDFYYFGENELDDTARYINLKLMWQYRFSGDEVQFFYNESIELSQREIDVHESYYSQIYDGKFGKFYKSTMANMITLSMFYRGYEYAAKNKSKSLACEDSLYCIYGDCKALIRPSINTKGQLCFFSKPHSAESEHSHCDMEPIHPYKLIKRADLPVQEKSNNLTPTTLKDSDFNRPFLRFGRQVFDVKSGYLFNDNCQVRNSTKVYICSNKKGFGCKDKGYMREIDGEDKFYCTNTHTHLPPAKYKEFQRDINDVSKESSSKVKTRFFLIRICV